METIPGEYVGSEAQIAGKKKWPFKQLRSRLFGRMKKKEAELGVIKQSKSSSDVTTDVITVSPGASPTSDSEEDCLGGSGTLPSRALSHDSIFQTDQLQAETEEPLRVLSQESLHGGRIQALQLKLQQQNMRLGPPPLLVHPTKRMEDSGTTSEDDGLPRSPPDITTHDKTAEGTAYKYPEPPRNHSVLSLAGTGSEEEEQFSSPASSRPLSPAWVHSEPEHSGVDLESPAQFVSCLDSSAARHRMSVKPRNQRASAKTRNAKQRSSRPPSENLSDMDLPLTEQGEERGQAEMEEKEANEARKKEEEEKTGKREREVPVEQSVSPRMSMELPCLENSTLAAEMKPWRSVPSAGQDEIVRAVDPKVSEGRITANPLSLQHLPVETTAPLETMTQIPVTSITAHSAESGCLVPRTSPSNSVVKAAHLPVIPPSSSNTALDPVPLSPVPRTPANGNATHLSPTSDATLPSSAHNQICPPASHSSALSSPSTASCTPTPMPLPRSPSPTITPSSVTEEDLGRPQNSGLAKPPILLATLDHPPNGLSTNAAGQPRTATTIQSLSRNTSQFNARRAPEPAAKCASLSSTPATPNVSGPPQRTGVKREEERVRRRGGGEHRGGEREEEKENRVHCCPSDRGRGGGGGGGNGARDEGVAAGGKNQNQLSPPPQTGKSSARREDPTSAKTRSPPGKRRPEGVAERAAAKLGESEDESSGKRQEGEVERGNTFGVTLRPTSQSLKYRPETIQSDPKMTRHSVKVKGAGRDLQPIGVDTDGRLKDKSELMANKVLRKVDNPVSKKSLPPAGCYGQEPSWMSLAREKSETLQRLQTTGPVSLETSPEMAPGHGTVTQLHPPVHPVHSRPSVKAATQPPPSSSSSLSATAAPSSSSGPSQPSMSATGRSSLSVPPPPYPSASSSPPPTQPNIRPKAKPSSLELSSSQPPPSSSSPPEPNLTSVPQSKQMAKSPSLPPPPYSSLQRGGRSVSKPPLLPSSTSAAESSATSSQLSALAKAKASSLPPPPYPSSSSSSHQETRPMAMSSAPPVSSSSSLPSPATVTTSNAQPSWMELAKRKSRAWSDKSVD